MASNFTVLSTKFYDQIFNGEDFETNTSDFNTVLTGNVDDKIKLVQTIQVHVDYGISSTKNVVFNERAWDTSFCSFTWANNAYSECFYLGAMVRVQQGSNSHDFPILGITGMDNREILLDKATDGADIALFLSYATLYTDVTFKLLTAPTYINYKYGINKTTDLSASFLSYIDSNVLAYYNSDIPASPTIGAMAFIGGQQGANLGEVGISYLGEDDDYRHNFYIEHTFKIPFYKAGQVPNLESTLPIDGLIGTDTWRYDNRFEMGNAYSHNAIFINKGLTGNVGYFNENFNGLENSYSIENLNISNASLTGVLEAMEVNTVTFQVVSSDFDWESPNGVIVGHSMLPTPIEYQNRLTPFDTNWIWRNCRNEIDATAVSSGIITDFTASIDEDDAKILNVSYKITYTTDQKALITNQKYLLWITVCNKNIGDITLIDRVNLIVDVRNYSKNNDVSGLISVPSIQFYPSWKAFVGQTAFTNFSGGDGDLWGMWATFKLNTILDAKLISAVFKIIASNGSNEFELLNKPISVGLPLVTTDGTYIYQLLDLDYVSDLNLPTGEQLNKVVALIELPVSLPSTTQDVSIQLGFQTPWRSWIENLSVPLSFYDISKPNNNRNFKTSNYSEVSSYEIFGVLDLGLKNNVNSDTTIVRLKSDPSEILDFDVAGWTGFDGFVKLYNSIGVRVYSVRDGDEDLTVKIEFKHSLGVLSLSVLAGEIWAEYDQSTAKPNYLATYRDMTSVVGNVLQPSDTLETGNYQFVEIVTETDIVTLICKTKASNIIAGRTVNIYGKLWKK